MQGNAIQNRPTVTGRRVRDEVSFTGLTPGNTGHLEVKDKGMIHGFDFLLGGGLTSAMIESIQVLLDEQIIMDLTGLYLEHIVNRYTYGNDSSISGVLKLPFQRWDLGIVGDFRTSINMGAQPAPGQPFVDQINLRVKLAANAPATSSIDVKTILGKQIVGEGIGAGQIPRIFSQTKTGIVKGRNDFDQIITDTNDNTRRTIDKIVFDVSPDDIDRIELRSGELPVDMIIPKMAIVEQRAAGLFPQSDFFILDPMVLYEEAGIYTKSYDRFIARLYLRDSLANADVPTTITATTHTTGNLT